MFFIIKKSGETTFNFLQNSAKIIKILETQKIINLLNGSDDENSKFATRKWYIIDNESNGSYSHENTIKFLKKSIESSLCDYSDAYILVTGNIAVTRTIAAANAGAQPQRKQEVTAATQVAFKSCALCKKYRRVTNEILLMKQILLILQCLCTID